MAPDSHDVTLAGKCLNFSKILSSQGKPFKLSLKQGGFSFFLSTMEPRTSETMEKARKKSPSTLKRNANRREEYIQKELVDRETCVKEKETSLKVREENVLNVEMKEKEILLRESNVEKKERIIKAIEKEIQFEKKAIKEEFEKLCCCCHGDSRGHAGNCDGACNPDTVCAGCAHAWCHECNECANCCGGKDECDSKVLYKSKREMQEKDKMIPALQEGGKLSGKVFLGI